jgi:hypothetical protein
LRRIYRDPWPMAGNLIYGLKFPKDREFPRWC